MPLPNDTNQGWSKLIEDFKELEKDPQKLDELRLKWCTIQDISTSHVIGNGIHYSGKSGYYTTNMNLCEEDSKT